MPFESSEITANPFLRLLVMGGPKTGKTSMCVSTAPSKVLVILCEADAALSGAARRSKFSAERVRGWNSMQTALKEAREGVDAGRYKTIVVDPLSDFASELELELLKSTNNDGRRAYPEYNRRIAHVLSQLFALEAHVIVISHYIETGGEMDGQIDKTGAGIVPLLAGKARALVAAKFNDVVWFDISKKEGQWQKPPYNGRVFVTGPQGAWGPGCRSLEGARTLPADIKLLIHEIQTENNKPIHTNTNTSNVKPLKQVSNIKR